MREHQLWQIGSVDHDSSDFALSGNPDAVAHFGEVNFCVGSSDAKLDWPYVQPGPDDEWGGSQTREYRIRFDSEPLAGACKLVLHLVDVNPMCGSTLAIRIGGVEAIAALPPGVDHGSLYTSSCTGALSFDVPFACSLLQKGENRIEIRTISGGFVVYDCIQLVHLPDELQGGDIHEIIVQSLPFFAGDGGSLRQAVEVIIDNWGQDVRGTLSLRIQDEHREILQREVDVPFGNSIHRFLVPEIENAVAAIMRFSSRNVEYDREAVLEPRRHWQIHLADHEGVADEFFGMHDDVASVYERLKQHLTEIDNARYPFHSILLDVLTDDNSQILRIVKDWESHWTFPRFVVSSRQSFFREIADRHGAEALDTFGDMAQRLLMNEHNEVTHD